MQLLSNSYSRNHQKINSEIRSICNAAEPFPFYFFFILLKQKKPYQSCVCKVGIQKLETNWPFPNGCPSHPPRAISGIILSITRPYFRWDNLGRAGEDVFHRHLPWYTQNVSALVTNQSFCGQNMSTEVIFFLGGGGGGSPNTWKL